MALILGDQNGPEFDDLFGTRRGDTIRGFKLEDTLFGRRGNDILDGGRGDDQLTGDSGADTFVFKSGYGQDQIEDFSFAQGDGLDLHRTTFGVDDLSNVSVGANHHDKDHDGNYIRQTSANGKPEVQLYFHNSKGGFDSLTIIGITISELRQDVKNHPGHYDFA